MPVAGEFLDDLAALGVGDFYGVPDSLLSPLISTLEERAARGGARLEITGSEGGAVGLAIGAHLATGGLAAVFLQNSGLGNAVNPLTSLAAPQIYGVPMLLIVGWRGEMRDGVQQKDEPQHVFQGEITLDMLDLLGIPFEVIAPESARAEAREAAARMVAQARDASAPAALVIRKGSFGKATEPGAQAVGMTREAAIAAALRALPGDVPVVGTTGKISREIYELCRAEGFANPTFLSVGGMGHASLIAAGVARHRSGGHVACFDGDGATLMQAGNLATAAQTPNLLHVVFNNRVHDSVGGQPTAAPDLDLAALARAMGYGLARRIDGAGDIAPAIAEALGSEGAAFLEILVAPGARADLGRPKEHPRDAKRAFMRAMGVNP